MKHYSKDIQDVYEILSSEFTKHKTPVVDLIKIQTDDPFKVLIATILSARTRDDITSAVVKKLFDKVQRVDDLDKYSTEQIEKMIYPVGFFREKAKHLKLLPEILNSRFNGIIPQTIDELIELPGVGRKTANLVVAVAFNKPAVCVDVHVHRITNRIGYLSTKSPLETEMALRKHLPQKFWITFNSCFVSFGQNTCRPVNPKCNCCPIVNFCGRINVKTKNTADS